MLKFNVLIIMIKRLLLKKKLTSTSPRPPLHEKSSSGSRVPARVPPTPSLRRPSRSPQFGGGSRDGAAPPLPQRPAGRPAPPPPPPGAHRLRSALSCSVPRGRRPEPVGRGSGPARCGAPLVGGSPPTPRDPRAGPRTRSWVPPARFCGERARREPASWAVTPTNA